MIVWIVRAMALMWFAIAPPALAHEIRPAYLQIDETAPDLYNVLWKVPSRGGTVLDIQPQFDPQFTLTAVGEPALLNGFVVYRFRLTGEKKLPGTGVTIRNLPRTTVDVLANANLLDGEKHTFLLHPKTHVVTIPLSATNWSVIGTYTTLGVEHILFGFDHLLFVLALIILTSGLRSIVKTVTAFTLAHSITLSLAALGYVHVPGPPVETTIALSILFLAVEILRIQDGKETLTGQKPWLVAFTFGLLHGLGFASALSQIGLPQSAIPLALASFNIGVELGQLIFVFVVLSFARGDRISLDVHRKSWIGGTWNDGAAVVGSVSECGVNSRLYNRNQNCSTARQGTAYTRIRMPKNQDGCIDAPRADLVNCAPDGEFGKLGEVPI
jgi:hydrogenase/urease accessory protein HupE